MTSDDKINDIAIKIPFEDGTSVDGILQSYDAEKRLTEFPCLTMKFM